LQLIVEQKAIVKGWKCLIAWQKSWILFFQRRGKDRDPILSGLPVTSCPAILRQ
jgi:hypothetical protein